MTAAESAESAPPDAFDDPRITAIGLLAETYTGLFARITPQVGGFGLGLVDFQVLIRLARSSKRRLRMSDLASQVSLSTSGITRVVDRLEKEDLVRREPCPDDRRSLYAVLTDAGHARMEAVLPGHLELLQQWLFDPLAADQLQQLLDGLRVLRDTVHPGARAGISGE